MLAFATPVGTSIEAFLDVSATSRYQVELGDYAHSLVQQGNTRPGWCLIGLEHNVPVARAALWAPAGESVPTDIVMIEADWNEEASPRAGPSSTACTSWRPVSGPTS
jgi:hypothetical protein